MHDVMTMDDLIDMALDVASQKGYYGSVEIIFQDGKAVYIKKTETMKPPVK